MNRLQKNTLSLALATIASTLFYQESLGINCLLFSLATIPFVLFVRERPAWRRILMAWIPVLASSAMIVVVPQKISYLIWLVSYLLMWSTISFQLKPLLLPLQSLYALVARFFEWVSMKERQDVEPSTEPKPKKNQRKSSVWVVSSVIIFAFLILYVTSNPVFAELLYQINWSFFDFGFIAFTLVLTFPLSALLFMRVNKALVRANQLPTDLLPEAVDEDGEQEFKIARITTWGLVALLTALNAMDIVVLLSGQLPAGLTYADYLHQGFYTLIFSICLAIALLVYFFRSQLNFHEHIAKLRMAATAWIIQNALLALLTGIKNFNYISMYGLTYKRIAVLFCLICTLIGLVIALKKVRKPTTNWLFYNRMSKAAFIVSIGIAMLPYDQMITHYNLDQSKTFDFDYLCELEHPDWLAIDAFLDRHPGEYQPYIYSRAAYRIKSLQKRQTLYNWPSWNLYLSQYRME